MGARREPWIARLGAASAVLVSFDGGDAGDEASRYWLDTLPNAKRWRPYWDDPSQMLIDKADLRNWIKIGLHY